MKTDTKLKALVACILCIGSVSVCLADSGENSGSVFVGTDLDRANKAEFAGKEHQFNIYLRNYERKAYAKTQIELWVEDLKGERIFTGEAVKTGSIKHGARLTLDYSWAIPAEIATGNYKLKIELKNEQALISQNTHNLYILGTEDQMPAMAAAEIALVKAAGSKEQDGVNVGDILDKLGIAYTVIEKFYELDKYEVLIVPAYHGPDDEAEWLTIYPNIVEAADEIKDWIVGGGRLLCFEQSCRGFVPWQSELQTVRTDKSTFSNPVRPAHPVLKDFMIRNFADWEGKQGIMIDRAILPLNQNGIMSVLADNGLAMALAETKIGNGVSIISQLNAVSRYGRDSVATHYVNQLIKYVSAGRIWAQAATSPAVAMGKEPEFSYRPRKFAQSIISKNRWAAQSFKPETITNLKWVELQIVRLGDPNGNLIVELHSDASDAPSDQILAKFTARRISLRPQEKVDAKNTFVKFDLRHEGLKHGQIYWIVVKAESSDEVPNVYSWIQSAGEGTFKAGCGLVSSDSGRSWQDNPARYKMADFGLKIYGVSAEFAADSD